MGNQVTVLTVFASSPSDVTPERLALLRAIERANRMGHIREQFLIRPFRFEDTPPLAGQEAQIVVDNACSIEDCYLVVCILWHRMGTPFVHPESSQSYRSGTEYEFLTAYDAYLSRGQPYVLLYRKTAQLPDEKEAVDPRIDAFFDKFEGPSRVFQGLYVQFSGTEEFEDRVLLDILNHLHNHPPELEPQDEAPSFLEEDRRLDAAIPSEAGPKETIELWVKICTKDSPGLKQELPEQAETPGKPSASDTRGEFMSVAFERNDEVGGTSPLHMAVDILSTDFEVLDGKRVIELRYEVDSPTLIFPLRVAKSGPSGYIQVRVRTKSIHGDYWIENGSLSCQVQIRSNPVLSRIRSVLSALPRRSKSTKDKELDQAAKLHERIEETIEESRRHVEGGSFNEAVSIVEELPEEKEQVRKLKENLLGQIAEAEDVSNLNRRIEDAVEQSKRYVNQGDFLRAKRIVQELPNESEQVRQLKQKLLSQIEEAEEQSNIKERIEEAIEKCKEYVKQGKFREARRVVQQLPDTPEELKELKRNLLSQIDEAKERSNVNQRIEEAIEKSKKYVSQGKFRDAKRVIENLPDSPKELKDLKSNLLGQIRQAESTPQIAQEENNDLLMKLVNANVDLNKLTQIAKDNNLDMDNPMEFNALLKAIVKQVGL